MATTDDLTQWVQNTINSSAVILFSKTTCPYCLKTKDLLKRNKIKHATIEVDKHPQETALKQALQTFSKIRTVPQLYSRGKFIGDSSTLLSLEENGTLVKMLDECPYDYDLIVIGGGSGGLAASKEAARYGAKVAVLDYVDPTPKGTTWGLGGTCVNVGCIPKKLMHQAALINYAMEDAPKFGWNIEPSDVKHSWTTMVDGIQEYIRSLNWGYRTALRTNSVNYINAKGSLTDEHTVQATAKDGKITTLTASNIILATGERPRYPNIPGDKEYAITSDDLFSLPYSPGKTLVVGASYVALECAGFLHSLGEDATVMVRSIFLRGFDQQMADLVGLYMENHGMKFVRSCVPTSIEQLEPVDLEANKPGLLRVHGKFEDGKEFVDEFNTVILAIGRDPNLKAINVPAVGVNLDKNGRVICSEDDKSSVDSIYAIGDINAGKPQLTPVAIQAGRLLARRLFAGSVELCEYDNVATTVFTPLEYGACGLSEEDAIARYGQENIEVYHSNYKPLEWTVAHREDNFCYAKLICLKTENDRVVGLHLIGPNAGEITQGYAVAIKLRATKADFDRTIGIHPTCSEIFTTLHVTKSSGASTKVTGC